MSAAAPAIGWPAWTALNRRRRAMVADLARASGIDRSEIEEWLKREIITAETRGKSDSSKDLDARGWVHTFDELNNRLAAYGKGDRTPAAAIADAPSRKAQVKRSRTQGQSPAYLLSARQRYVLVTLQQLLAMSNDEFTGFCRKQFGFRIPATRAQANKVINALKPMAIRKLRIPERVAIALAGKLDHADRLLLEDVSTALAKGKQGASVKIGSLPILLKIFGRYGINAPATEDN